MKGRHSSEGVHDYDSADAYIEANARDPNACHLPQTAALRRWDEDKIVVLYRDYAIVTYRADGRIVLDANGDRDKVMQDRMNSYTPNEVGVEQRDEPWRDEPWRFTAPLGNFHYHDGFTFDVEGVLQRQETR